MGHTDWEIDVCHGGNEGLAVAEVEIASSTEAFDKPDWPTRDVSDDPRYFNNNLTVHPYKTWPSTTQGSLWLVTLSASAYSFGRRIDPCMSKVFSSAQIPKAHMRI